MRAAATLVVAAVLVLTAPAAPAASGPASATAREHGPIPLYQPPPFTPPELVGSDVQPLVRAKLEIDALGKVTRVDVTAIEPSSPLDDLFKKVAIEELSGWRFAPAEKDGRAEPSETGVAIQFYTGGPDYAQPRNPDTALWFSATDAGFESARWSSRDKILALSAAARRKIADGIAARAERLLNPSTRVSAQNDWFEVVTDFGGQREADAILNDCMATYRALYDMLGTKIPPRPRLEQIRVYVFGSESQYKTFARAVTPFEWSGGVYCPAGVLAFHVQMPTMAFLISSLLHETTHAFVDRHLVRLGVHLPRSLDEGLAEYVGESDIVDGKIVLGAHAHHKQIVMTLYGTAYWQTPSRVQTEVAQHAQRQHRALTLGEILSAGPETFYGKDYDLYYAQGWLAVHFLRHGRPEWAQREFPAFLLYVAEGYPAEQAFRTVYGAPPEAFEAEYQRYVKSF